MFRRISEWFGRHPVVKATVSAAVSAAASGAGAAVYQAVSSGTLDPKAIGGVALAGAVTGLVNLFVKRPQDGICNQRPGVVDAASYIPCSLAAGHAGPHNYQRAAR